MTQIFISHSKDDEPGRAFLQPYFTASNTKAFFYGWEDPQPPHAPALRNAIQSSVGMIVLVSDHLSQNIHTAAWVSYEVGLAHMHNIPVIIIEALPEGFQNFEYFPPRLPVAHVDYFLYYFANMTEKVKFLQDIIDSASIVKTIRMVQSPFIQTLDKHLTDNVICGYDTCRASYRILPDMSGFICPVCRQSNKIV